MEFRLFYRGPLKSNGTIKDKQMIRRGIHKQLKELWSQQPLSYHHEFLKVEPKDGEVSVLMPVGKFHFAPLVSSRLHLVAEIRVLFLRPGAPGQLIVHGGDLDNRIKTLLDALRVPKEVQEVPADDEPKEGEEPFFCLLEDDALVTGVSVDTDRLLEETVDPGHVILVIHVRVRTFTLSWNNMALVG